MWFAAIFGCSTHAHTTHCETTTFSVEDDVVVEAVGVSADDGLATVVGAFGADASLADSTPLPLDVTVVRGGGAAYATVGVTYGGNEDSHGGIFHPHYSLDVYHPCPSYLEVPVDLDVTSADGTLAFTADATLSTFEAWGDDAAGWDGSIAWEVTADIDPTDITAFPEVPGADEPLTVAVQWGPDGLFHWVSLWSNDAATGQTVLILDGPAI